MTDGRKLARPDHTRSMIMRGVHNARLVPLVFFAGWLGLAADWGSGDGGPSGVGSALAIDMDLRQPMFTQPRQQRGEPAPATGRGAGAARDGRYQPFQPPQQRGFIDSLFGAPQRPKYQPGYRPHPPASAGPARAAPKRTAPRPRPAPIIRPVVEITEFVYLLAPAGARSLGSALEFVLADRPIADVKLLHPSGGAPPQAQTLLAALPSPLAPAGKTAVLVITAAPDWSTLTEAQLTTLVAEISAAMASGNSPLIWVGLPPLADKAETARSAAVNGVLRAAAARTGGGFVDAWAVFADDSGGFAAWGPAVSGENVRLREDGDGTMTRAGERKLAHFIMSEVRRIQARLAGAPKPQIGSPVDPFSLPGPQLPSAASVAPQKPAVGPVMPLNYVVSEPNGKLDPLDGGRRDLPDAATRQALINGAPAVPAPGRADDFRWPKKPGG